MPEVRSYDPYRTKILVILDHFCRTFLKFETTTGQSSSGTVKNCPWYSNNKNAVGGHP